MTTRLAAILLLALSGPAWAQPVALTARPVAEGLSQPVFVTAPPGDTRLFVVEKTGTIRIVADGAVAPAPFLDISAAVSRGNEQGLLGLAFHPDFARNGRFFIDYTDRAGDTRIVAYRAGADGAADPGSARALLRIEQPYANHNGGWLGFGPEGYLYIGTGDGGSGGDPQGNGQNPATLLGKLLRIDVDGGEPYAIPPENPFADGGGAPEVFAFGLRNPWRIAFDGERLFIGDVGQNRWEEVDVLSTADAGANLGWNVMEGERCYQANACDETGKIRPVHVYSHDEGCSITGGYVYRGKAIPEIAGQYFFGDFCSGKVWSFAADGAVAGSAPAVTDWTGMLGKGQISSFGLDAEGELYITTLEGGVYRVEKAE